MASSQPLVLVREPIGGQTTRPERMKPLQDPILFKRATKSPTFRSSKMRHGVVLQIWSLSIAQIGALVSGAPAPKTNDLRQAIAADLQSRDWSKLIVDYEQYLRVHTASNTQPMFLEIVQSTINKGTRSPKPIDSFHLNWTWHPDYEKCRRGYAQAKENLRVALAGKPFSSFEQHIAEALESSPCRDARPQHQAQLSIIGAIVDLLFELADPDKKKYMAKLLQDYYDRHHSGSAVKTAEDYLIAARIKLLNNAPEDAVKLLITGLHSHPNAYKLQEELFPLAVDRGNYILQDVMRVEGPTLLKNAPQTFVCIWSELGSASDWHDALDRLEEYAERCHTSDQTKKGSIQAARAFLHTGQLAFKEADSILDDPELPPPQSPERLIVVRLLQNVQGYRTRLSKMLIREATSAHDRGVEAIKARLNSALQGATRIAREKSSTQNAHAKRALEKEEYERKARAYVEEQERLRKREPSLRGNLALLERKIERDVGQAEQAAAKALELARNGRWWEAKAEYDFANYNLKYFREVSALRDDFNDQFFGSPHRRNPLNLDLSVLGFGWRKEYVDSRVRREEKRRDLLNRVKTASMTTEDLREGLVELSKLSGKDVRPECKLMQEVAEIQAEALQWHAALSTLRSSCVDLRDEDYAGIIGYFSTGLRGANVREARETIASVLDFVMALDSVSVASSQPLQAAVVSLVHNLKRNMSGSIPAIKPYAQVPHSLGNLRSVTLERILQAMDRKGNQYAQFLPLIEEVFRVQQNNGVGAYYMREASLYEYYKKDGDFWQAYIHLLEAFNSRDQGQDRSIRLGFEYLQRNLPRDVNTILQRGELSSLRGQLVPSPKAQPSSLVAGGGGSQATVARKEQTEQGRWI